MFRVFRGKNLRGLINGNPWRAIALAVLASCVMWPFTGCARCRGEVFFTAPASVQPPITAANASTIWYVAPAGSATIPGAAALDGKTGTIYIHEDRLGICVPLSRPTSPAPEANWQ